MPQTGARHATVAFGALVLAQAAHSIEESAGRLWETFPPARFMAGLLSADLERNFILLNALIFAFGLWCLLWPIRRGWAIAVPLAWLWVAVELANGAGHTLWSLWMGGYTPGVGTAPLLLLAAGCLAHRLLHSNTHNLPRSPG